MSRPARETVKIRSRVVAIEAGTRRGILAGMADPEVGAPRVLVVDDEKALASVIASYLEQAGFQVLQEHTGPAAVTAAERDDPDVIILDLGLPGLDGVEVCRRIRTFSDCYILMLTARGDEMDRLIGLSVGADDYLTKPFSNRELVARVRTVLRRPRRTAGGADVEGEPIREFGELRIDPNSHEVWLGRVPVQLTRTEFDILDAISRRPRFALSRRQLMDEVWGEAWGGDEHVVDVHIANLRRKLGDDPGAPRYVLTVRGVGYRMGKG